MSNLPSFAVPPVTKELVVDSLDEVGLSPKMMSTMGGQTYFFFATHDEVDEAIDAIAHLDVNPLKGE